MKNRVVFTALLAVCLALFAGCKPNLSTKLIGPNGQSVYDAKVADGQTIHVPKGTTGSLKGIARDVTFSPLKVVDVPDKVAEAPSETEIPFPSRSGQKEWGGLETGLTFGGIGAVSLATIAFLWPAASAVTSGCSGEQAITIPAINMDTIVRVGDRFTFYLVVIDDGPEGEGEQPQEGEGEPEGEPVPTGSVPNVVGMNQLQAGVAITATHCLVVGTVSWVYDPTVPAGQVISTTPPTGTTMDCGMAINLVVSKGPAPAETTTVPNVVGLTQVAATSALTAANLVIGTVTEVYDATVPAGQVISTSPAGGTIVDLESAVGLVVSKGPEPTAVFGLAVSSPVDGLTVVGKATVVGHVTGPNPVNIVVVPPDALNTFRVEGALPPYDLNHEFPLTIAGTGLFTVRVTDLVTHEVLETSRAVTVVLAK